MIYTQSRTLYDKIPDAPRPEFSVPPPPKSNKDSHVNEPLLASEVNAVSTEKGKHLKQPRGKKKNKGKKKKREESSPEKSSANPSGQWKPPVGCHICDEDHWTREFPHKAEVKKLFKGSKTFAVLTNPFPKCFPIPSAYVVYLKAKK